MDRQAVLLAADEPRPVGQADDAAVGGVLEAGKPVRPRVQDRNAHHRAALGVGRQSGPSVQQLLAPMTERDARHAQSRRERCLQLTGRQRHRLEPLQRAAADGGRPCRHEVHGGSSRPRGRNRYGARKKTGATWSAREGTPASTTGETHRCQTRPRGTAPTGAVLHDDEGIAMATLCRAYTTEQDAHAAVDRLLTGGLSGAEVRVLMGDAVQDSRDAPVGGFAGTSTAARETVGSYAGLEHSGREAMGSFTGDPEDQRRGGFRDVDRETVTTHREGVRHVRIASHHNLEQMLVEAGLDEATATSDVHALHHGRILVLVESAMTLDEIAGVIDA